MKHIAALAAAIICTAVSLKAQPPMPGRSNEIGINAGVSPFLKPFENNMAGEKTKLTYAASLNYTAYLEDRYSLGFDVMMTSWKTEGTTTLIGPENQPYGTHPTEYIFADRALSFSLRFNRVFHILDDWNYRKANFYVGVAAGLQFTNGEGGVTYSQSGGIEGPDRRYMSRYNYTGGMGYTAGIQLGYVHYFNDWIGFNIEAAPRFAHIFNVDTRYNKANDRFATVYFPVMAGLRFRF